MTARLALAVLMVAGCEKAGREDPRPPPVRPSDAAPAPRPADAGPADALRQAARERVRQGFAPPAAIVAHLVEVSGDQGRPVSREAAGRLVDEELARHRAEEATWTEATDCDRLDAAFAELERSGILARQDFGDCGACGSDDMDELIEQARRGGEDVRGYTFFHQQDTEGALAGQLYLAYGAVKDGDPAAVAIGREVVRALAAEGLTVEWDGSIERRIGLSLEWRKRRFTRPPAGRP